MFAAATAAATMPESSTTSVVANDSWDSAQTTAAVENADPATGGVAHPDVDALLEKAEVDVGHHTRLAHYWWDISLHKREGYRKALKAEFFRDAFEKAYPTESRPETIAIQVRAKLVELIAEAEAASDDSAKAFDPADSDLYREWSDKLRCREQAEKICIEHVISSWENAALPKWARQLSSVRWYLK